MIRCSHCQHENRSSLLAGSELSRCAACGALLPTTGTTASAPPTRLFHARWIGWTFLLGLSGFCVAAGLRYRHSTTLRVSWDATLDATCLAEEGQGKARQQAWKATLASQEAQESQRWLDPKFRSGEAARERRDREWALRLAQDPSLAVSALELKLVQMRALGQNPQLSDEQALLELARLASPPGSRLEVVPEGDGYLLRVAFSMATLAPNEAGASTQHRSVADLKREVREVSARLVRDVLDAGDTRRLQRLTVSCNRAIRQNLIPSGATPEERALLLSRAKVNMRRIYRVAIARPQMASVADWSTVSLARVLELMRVEYDELKDIVIESLGAGELPKVDPQQPLEF